MKLLGLIGGVSPESTELYYRLLNAAVRERLGADHSAELLVYALDFGEMHERYAAQDWDGFRAKIADAGERLKAAGADGLMICSNTSHLAADALRAATGLPIVHIVDETAVAIRKAGVRKPLLLGTPITMTGFYYRPYLGERHGIECLVPSEADMAETDRIIFDELCEGEVVDASRLRLLAMIEEAKSLGGDGVILGCTELALILRDDDVDSPLFDSTRLHAAAAARFMFDERA